MNNLEALKGLYVALGGDADDVKDITLIADMITAIATVAAAATAPELPEVKAADNGKVLKVVDGKWAVGTDATE
jgi:dTDP-D-glucose 4,6-dehydratase